MLTENPNLHSLLERIERLETTNRRMKRVGWAAATAAILAMVMGAMADTPEVVEAQQFVVRDKNGSVWGRFGLQPFKVGLSLYEPGGKELATMYHEFEHGTWLKFLDQQGKKRLSIGAEEKGMPALEFVGAGGSTIALMKDNGDNGADLMLYGNRQNPAAMKASAGIYVMGTGGQIALKSNFRDGKPEASILLAPKVGLRKAMLTADEEKGKLEFFDVRGQVVRTLP